MEDTLCAKQIEASLPTGAAGRLAWQEPAIVLERSLLAAAQDPSPTRRAGRAAQRLLGPLNTSGGSGTCYDEGGGCQSDDCPSGVPAASLVWCCRADSAWGLHRCGVLNRDLGSRSLRKRQLGGVGSPGRVWSGRQEQRPRADGGAACAASAPTLPAVPDHEPCRQVATLSVRTPTYRLDGATLRVPGYGAHGVPGAPALPVWSTVVELPPTGEPILTVEPGAAQLLSQPMLLAAVPAPQPVEPKPYGWLTGEDLPAAVATLDRPDPAIYQTDAFYPATLAQAGMIQWQAGRRLLQVRVFPFQYNPVAGMLRYYADIRVTVGVAESGGAGERGREGVERERGECGSVGELGERAEDGGRGAAHSHRGARALSPDVAGSGDGGRAGDDHQHCHFRRVLPGRAGAHPLD